jgi:NADH-quinone oxidoreductase subunit L
LLTAFYMTRQVWLVFYGPERWRERAAVAAEPGEHPEAREPRHNEGNEPHESPPTMVLPLMALAGLSVVGGLLNLPFVNQNLDFLAEWLHPVFVDVHEIHASSFGSGFALSTAALVIAVVGIVLGRALYRNGLTAEGHDPGEVRLGPIAKVLANAYYFDVGVARFVSGPATVFARFLNEGIDRATIDGAVNGIGNAFRSAGGGLRRFQSGLVRNYALGIVFGTVLLLAYVFARSM